MDQGGPAKTNGGDTCRDADRLGGLDLVAQAWTRLIARPAHDVQAETLRADVPLRRIALANGERHATRRGRRNADAGERPGDPSLSPPGLRAHRPGIGRHASAFAKAQSRPTARREGRAALAQIDGFLREPAAP